MEMGTCPACDAGLIWRHNGVWCDRCHRKVETCCEGAPQQCHTSATDPTVPLRSEVSPVLPSYTVSSTATAPFGGHSGGLRPDV